MRFCYLLFAFILLVRPATGQASSPVSDPDSVIALPGIEILATRYGSASSQSASRVTAFDRAILDATAARDAGEALARMGGFQIRRYGSGLALPSLRGGQASQTLLLIDGMPLYDPQLGQVDLSLIPASLLQSITTMHGAGGSLYGSSSLTGIVNFNTLRPGAAPRAFHAALGAGPFGERSASLKLGTRRERLSTAFAVSHHVEEGDFPYLNASLISPRPVRRDSANRRLTAIFAKAGLDHHGGTTTLAGWLNRGARQLPGLATGTSQGERQWDDLNRGWIEHVQPFESGILALRTAFQQSALRYVNDRLDLDQTGRTTGHSVSADWKLQAGEYWSLDTGFDGHRRAAHHPSLQSNAVELQSSLFMSAQYRLPHLRIFPAWRFDAFHYQHHPSQIAFNPSLGFNWQPFATEAFRVKGRAARSFRAPTFNDRFWQPGGNPELNPESGWNFETGVYFEKTSPSDRISLEATLYRQRIRDQITWIPLASGYWSPVNLNRTITNGIETSAQVERTLNKTLSINAGLFSSYTDARDRSDPTSPSYRSPLRYVPRHQLKGSAGAQILVSSVTIFGDVFAGYSSRRYITTDATQWLESYLTFDAHLRCRWRLPAATIVFGFLLENSTNHSYEIIKGYPMPPRRLRFQLSLELPGALQNASSSGPKK